jgi:hemoglobin-like flavoprotein
MNARRCPTAVLFSGEKQPRKAQTPWHAICGTRAVSLTARQVDLLQQTWRSVLPVGDVAAELFYGKLFSLDPKIRLLFKNDMKDQGRNLTAMISVAVGGLERPERIMLALRQLGRRHAAYGVRDEHYEKVAVALAWMLEKCLGEAFTEEARQAWSAAYELLARTMKEACVSRAAC